MKRIINAALLVTVFFIQNTGFAQGFQIKGNLTDLPDNTIVRLYDSENQTVIDTVVTKNQTFQLDGILPNAPRSVVLHIQSSAINAMEYLFIGNENITINGNASSLPGSLNISGSKYHAVQQKLDRSLLSNAEKKKDYNEQLKKLYQAGQLTDSIKEVYLGKNGMMQQLELEKRQTEKEFILKNSNTDYGLYMLNLYKNNLFTDSELLAAYKKLPRRLQKSKKGIAINSYLKHPRLSPGDPYRDFTALDQTGKTVVFRDLFNNRYLLIDFSTPTCGHSMNSRPMLQQLQQQHTDKVTLITYYTENSKDHFEFFANPENHAWKHVWNTDGDYNEAMLKYRIGTTPTYFLFDKNGKLVETWTGFNEETYAKILKLIE